MEAALLMFLSKYNLRAKDAIPYKCTLPDGSSVELPGLQTNDAPCRYLLRCAACNADKITHILCITSQEDTLPITPDGLTTAEYFQNVLTGILREDDILRPLYGEAIPVIVPIPYDYGPDAGSPNMDLRAKRLYQYIMDFFSGPSSPQKVYIDYTGGMRDSIFLTTEISRFLEYSHVACGEIAYANLGDRAIYSLNNVYEMFRILNGIHDFVTYGNAGYLFDTYQQEGNAAISRLLTSLRRFSQAMSLCAIADLDKILTDLRKGITELEEYCPQPADSIASQMLKDFLPQIKTKLNLSDNEQETYLNLICWCLDNGLLQQALTLYTEKVPELCFKAELLNKELMNGYKPGNGRTREVYGIYDSLINRLEYLGGIDEFKEYLNRVLDSQNHTPKLKLFSAITTYARDRTYSAEAAAAIARVQEFIDLYYSKDDSRLNEAGKQVRLYTGDALSKDARRFVSTILNNSGFTHFFFVNDAALWKNAPCNQGSPAQEMQKKISALERLQKDCAHADISYFTKKLNHDELYQLVVYYFTIKVLRNNVNHASGKVTPEIQFCFDKGFISSCNVDYSTILDTLKNATSFIRSLLKKAQSEQP